jgi:hypothetical protein
LWFVVGGLWFFSSPFLIFRMCGIRLFGDQVGVASTRLVWGEPPFVPAIDGLVKFHATKHIVRCSYQILQHQKTLA